MCVNLVDSTNQSSNTSTSVAAEVEQNGSNCTWVNTVSLMKRHQEISANPVKARSDLLLLVKLFNWLKQFDRGMLTCLFVCTDGSYHDSQRLEKVIFSSWLWCRADFIPLVAEGAFGRAVSSTTVKPQQPYWFQFQQLNHRKCGTVDKNNHSAGTDRLGHWRMSNHCVCVDNKLLFSNKEIQWMPARNNHHHNVESVPARRVISHELVRLYHTRTATFAELSVTVL